MKQICLFDEKRDICATVAGLAIDLASAMETGIVVDTGTLGEYNDIDDPHFISHRVSDTFEALEAMKVIQKHGKKDNKPAPAPPAPPVNPVKGENE